MRQIFERDRAIRKAGGKIDRDGFYSSDGLQIPYQRFFEQAIFRAVQWPDQNTDFLGVRQPYRWFDRVVEDDFGCRTPGLETEKKKKNNLQSPKEKTHFHLFGAQGSENNSPWEALCFFTGRRCEPGSNLFRSAMFRWKNLVSILYNPCVFNFSCQTGRGAAR